MSGKVTEHDLAVLAAQVKEAAEFGQYLLREATARGVDGVHFRRLKDLSGAVTHAEAALHLLGRRAEAQPDQPWLEFEGLYDGSDGVFRVGFPGCITVARAHKCVAEIARVTGQPRCEFVHDELVFTVVGAHHRDLLERVLGEHFGAGS